MKRNNILILFLAICATVSAQKKSVKVKFKHPDKEQTLVNKLNNVQLVTAEIKNRKTSGKMFVIDIVEYEKGEIASTISTGADCNVVSLPVVMANGDTAYYMHKPCNGITSKRNQISFPILFGGKLADSTFSLVINYPYQSSTFSLKGKEGDLLQPAFNEDTTKIELGVRTPLLLYFGGYKVGNGVFYCLAKTGEVEKMYTEFGVEHYYIIYLTIK